MRAQKLISQYKDEYMFNGLLCGPLLLKIIIHTVTGNSRVAIPAIRSRMNDIDTNAAEVEGNVEMITDFFAECWVITRERGYKRASAREMLGDVSAIL